MNMDEAKTLEWAISKLIDAQQQKVYGTITVQFEAGKIVFVRSEKTEKPPMA